MDEKNEPTHQISGCENTGDIYDVQNVQYGSMHRQMRERKQKTKTNGISRLNAIYSSCYRPFSIVTHQNATHGDEQQTWRANSLKSSNQFSLINCVLLLFYKLSHDYVIKHHIPQLNVAECIKKCKQHCAMSFPPNNDWHLMTMCDALKCVTIRACVWIDRSIHMGLRRHRTPNMTFSFTLKIEPLRVITMPYRTYWKNYE